jgi:hypothetical protein
MNSPRAWPNPYHAGRRSRNSASVSRNQKKDRAKARSVLIQVSGLNVWPAVTATATRAINGTQEQNRDSVLRGQRVVQKLHVRKTRNVVSRAASTAAHVIENGHNKVHAQETVERSSHAAPIRNGSFGHYPITHIKFVVG